MKGDPLNPADWLRAVSVDYDRVLRAMGDGDTGAAALWLEQAAEKSKAGEPCRLSARLSFIIWRLHPQLQTA